MCYFTILVILAGGQSNLTTSRIATTHGWFSGIRQVAPVCVCTPPMHASLGPDVKSQTASRSVQAFLHSSQQRVTILYNRLPRPPSKLPLLMGRSGPPSNTWFPWTTQVHNPNGISIGSAVFLHSSPQSVPILYNGPPLPLKIATFRGGSGPPCNAWFLGPT